MAFKASYQSKRKRYNKFEIGSTIKNIKLSMSQGVYVSVLKFISSVTKLNPGFIII